jgi:apolipoprotein N-acyltransferase
MHRLFDLRFVIGLFFLVVGLMLIVYGFTTGAREHAVNRICGILFTVFALFMLWLSRTNKNATGLQDQ